MKHSFVQKMLILTALLFLFVMAKPAAAFADGSDEAGNAEPTGVEEIGEHYGSRVTEQREKTVAQTNRKEVTVTLYLLKDGNKVLITRYYIDGVLVREEEDSLRPAPERAEVETEEQPEDEAEEPDEGEASDEGEEAEEDEASDEDEEPEEDVNQVVSAKTEVSAEGTLIITKTTVVLKNGTTITNVVVKDAITDKTTAYTITVRPDGTIERSEEQPLPAEAPAPAKAPADEEETADEEEEKDFQDTLDIFTARIEKVKSSINPESAMVYTPNMLCLNDMDEIMSRATRQGLAFMKSKNAYSFTRGEKLSAEEAFGKLDKSLSDWENVLYMSSCNNPSAFAPSVPFLPFNPFVSVPTSPAIPGLN